jgi:hypothetical protein
MADRFQNPVDIAEQSSSPSSPASGYGKLYPKADGKMYFKNAAGTEFDLTATGAGASDILLSEAISTNTAINNSSTPQTVLTKSIVGIQVGDIFNVEIFGNILNNSGSTRTYVHTFDLGGFSFAITDGGTIGASATNRSSHIITCRISIIATNNNFALAELNRGVPQAEGASQSIATTSIRKVFSNNATNLTGTKTFTYSCHGQSGTSTQTFELRGYTIRLVKQI